MNATFAHSGLGVGCPNCNASRRVWNRFLKKTIRCPQCTTRRRLDRAEAERVLLDSNQTLAGPKRLREIAAAVEQSIVDAVVNTFSFGGLPEHLVSTDRIMQRWAAAPTGTPAEDPDRYFKCRPPPLDAKTQEHVNDILKRRPGVKWFCVDWYCRDEWLSTEEMAASRQMSARQFGRERENVLVWLRQQFLDSGHVDLVNLVRLYA